MPRRPRPKFAPWTGHAFRATSYDVPLWALPNRRAGRWNLAGQGSTQYLCLDAEAPFAEMLRHEDLRSEIAAAQYRTTLWQVHVDEGAMVDYRDFDAVETAGFSPDAIVEDDHERCQAEADWLRGHGARGVLSTSASLPGSVNLTLFGPRVAIRWSARPRLASALPVQNLASGGPPAGLVRRVRFFGQPHTDLAHWRARRASRER
jgi:RES domain-containing protein